MVFGGNMVGHAHAQEDSWKHILRFLRVNMSNHSKL